MKIMNQLARFRSDEDGAVTVDWVVLTAAIVGLGIAVIATVEDGATSMAENIETELGKAGYVGLGTDQGAVPPN